MPELALDIREFRIRIACGHGDQAARVAAALREYVAAFETDVDHATPLAETDADTLAGIAAHPPNALHLLGTLLAPRFVLLHAGLIANGNGATAFAGRTGSGKTTASLVADRLGHALLGDDLVLIDWQTGDALALPTELHQRPWTTALLQQLSAQPRNDQPDRSAWRPLQRLVVFDDSAGPMTDALLRCTFGVTPATTPDHLRRLLQGVGRATLRRVPPLVWRETEPDAADRVALAVREWLGDSEDLSLQQPDPDDGNGAPSDLSGTSGMSGICNGDSMHPAVRRGQRVTIRPQQNAPRVGQVVAFQDPARGLLMHRVVAVHAATPGSPGQIHSRGDNSPGGGEIWPLDRLLGVVQVPADPPSGMRRAWVWLRHALGRALRLGRKPAG